jgi:hypothetical protein
VLAEINDDTDGCAAQFACGRNQHATARSRTEFGVVRCHQKEETMHGKNVGDGLSNIPKMVYKAATLNLDMVDAGSRATLLHFAAAKRRPEVDKSKKRGWWAVGRIFWGHYQHDRFLNGVVPEAKGFVGSMKAHQLVGLCEDKLQAEKLGPLWVRDNYCACGPCRMMDFKNCLFKNECGMMRLVKTPLVQQVRGALTMTAQLEESAGTIDGRQLLAVRFGQADSFWLARAMGKAFEVDEAMVHSTDQFEAGWLVMKIKWFEKERGRDYYVLAPAEHYLVVTTTVRVGGLGWEKTERGKYYLSDESESRILSAL